MDEFYRIGGWALVAFLAAGCIPRGLDRWREERERSRTVRAAMERLFDTERRRASHPVCCGRAMELMLFEPKVWWCETCDRMEQAA